MTQPPREIDVGALGEDVPLLEGIRTTRAIRRLLPDPVPPEKRGKLIRRAYSISHPMLNDERSGLFDHGGLEFFEV